MVQAAASDPFSASTEAEWEGDLQAWLCRAFFCNSCILSFLPVFTLYEAGFQLRMAYLLVTRVFCSAHTMADASGAGCAAIPDGVHPGLSSAVHIRCGFCCISARGVELPSGVNVHGGAMCIKCKVCIVLNACDWRTMCAACRQDMCVALRAVMYGFVLGTT